MPVKRETCPKCKEGKLIRDPFNINMLICNYGCGYKTEAFYGPTDAEISSSIFYDIVEGNPDKFNELFK